VEICVYVYTHAYMCVCTYTYTYMYMYIYIQMPLERDDGKGWIYYCGWLKPGMDILSGVTETYIIGGD